MTQHTAPSPIKVLVVDDHPDVRFLVRAILRDAGPPLEVAGEAAGAEEAVEAVDRLCPDVIVLDARMPMIDGFEAARRILARRPETAIVLCSAIVDDQIRARAEAAGIAACLSKDHFEAIPSVALELAGR